MASFSDKTPPPFDKDVDDYLKWKKKFKLWQSITDVAETKHGGLLVLRLDDSTQEKILELVTEEQIKAANGADTVITQLDQLVGVEATVTAFEAYEQFETYKRPHNVSIKDYCSEFQSRLKKVQTNGSTLADHVLAYRLLKSANLDANDERLVKATVEATTYAAILRQLKKISDTTPKDVSINESQVRVKEEPVDYLQQDTLYGGSYRRSNYDYRNAGRGENRGRREYGNSVDRRWNDRKDSDRRWNDRKETRGRGEPRESEETRSRKKRGKNPLDQNGRVTKCLACESINHWIKDCPDLDEREKNTYYENYEEDPEDENEDGDRESSVIVIDHASVVPGSFKDLTKVTLSCDTMNVAVLDCGAPKNVCGRNWLTHYISNLTEEKKSKVVYGKSKNVFKFGCGSKFPATESVSIPAVIGQRDVVIKTDVVEGDIPLLFSRESMKKTKSNLDFRDDTLHILGQKLNLNITESGHYALPLGEYSQLITDVARGDSAKFTLVVKRSSPSQTALKLHRQFAHPSAERLIKLVLSQGKECEDLVKAIQEVTNNCEVCIVYRRPPPRPVVGFSMATRFNQCVAMDLKKFGKVWVLHMICHATRLIAGAVIRNKYPMLVIKGVMQHWVCIYGAPDVFLSDNGGEFSNEEFRELGERFNINIKTTAAESPWSNGLVERHNAIMGDMIEKTMVDTKCSLELALMWCVTAHNTLTNVHGFSPFQLVFGRNPSLPAVQVDKPPALESDTVSDILRKNLNTMHAARQAYIRSESCEKVRRALRHNIRTTGEIRYVTGDRVYYKRLESRKWKGPAVVLGQDGKQVLVKHAGQYVRVHPCRLTLEKETIVGAKDSGAQVKNNILEGKKETRKVTFRSEDEEESIRNDVEVEAPIQVQEDVIDQGLGDLEPPTVQNVINENNDMNNETGSSLNESIDEDLLSSDGVEANQGDDNGDGSDSMTELSDNDAEIKAQSGSNTDEVISKPQDVEKLNVNEVEEKTEESKRRGRPRKNKHGSSVDVVRKENLLKSGVSVRYKMGDDDTWLIVKLTSRAGKSKGIHQFCWNTTNPLGIHKVVDFSKDVSEWELLDPDKSDEGAIPTEIYATQEYDEQTREERKLARHREMESWKANKVYTEVTNRNQSCISGKWVYRNKVIDNKPSVKARYVLRGYEEEIDFRTDSPTCKRESIRLLLVIIASKGWKINSIDFKTAFLQGNQIEREVFVKPPREANTNLMWRLNKTVYGLNDAPRQWYLRLKEIVINLGCKLSFIDNGLFMLHEKGLLVGLIVTHVDDILWGGEVSFEENVIKKLKVSLHISTEQDSAFRYLGVNVKQAADSTITISQAAYVDSLEPIEISCERLAEKEGLLTSSERQKLRGVMGQINWLAGISRPDIGFSSGQICRSSEHATVSDMVAANKLIYHIKNNQSDIVFPKLKNLEEVYIKVYTDASYNNLKDGGSQGGHIVFLTDGRNCCPLSWSSTKVRRMVKSASAAETLALLDGAESAYLQSKVIGEVIHGVRDRPVPVRCVTDNRNLFDSAHSTIVLTDKRLQLEMGIVREMLSKGEITLEWVTSQDQLSDVLTKKGASGSLLREVVSRGHF